MEPTPEELLGPSLDDGNLVPSYLNHEGLGFREFRV